MKKNFLAFLIVMLLPFAAFAHDFVVDGICYNVVSENELTCEVTFYGEQYSDESRNFYKDVVYVPEKVSFNGKEYSVIAIGERAFSGNEELLSVVLPGSIVSIEDQAFWSCSKFKSLTVPASVRFLRNLPFGYLPSLEYLAVEEGNPVYDSRGGCNAIINTQKNSLIVGCKSTVIPDGVETIADCAFVTGGGYWDEHETLELDVPGSVKVIEMQAFAGCRQLSAVTLHEGLESIGARAFCGTSVSRIVIPASVSKIDATAFQACDSLRSIKVKRGNKVYDSRKGCNAIIESATARLIAGCPATVIPEGVASIGEQAYYSSAIKEVKFPSSLKTIESRAFASCRELQKVVIPGNVKSVESSAFWSCMIEEVVVEDGVETIEARAFAACRNLREVSLPASLKKFGETGRFNAGVFPYCPELRRVKMASGNEKYYCNGNSIVEKESLTLIDGWGAGKCNLRNGYVKLRPKKIAESAFSGHEYITYIIIPETVEEIDRNAFAGCIGLHTVVCAAAVPPVLEEDAFPLKGGMYNHDLPLMERCVLVVPEGSLEAYRNAPGWKEFKHIKGIRFAGY